MKSDSLETLQYGAVPPQAIEAEKAILGALLLERDVFFDTNGLIDTESFYKTEYQKIFLTIKNLYLAEKVADLITVTQKLKDEGVLESVGGVNAIMELTKNVASAANIESHCRIIAEKFYQRETIRKAINLMNMAYANEDVESIANEWTNAAEVLDNIFTVTDTGTLIKDVLKSAVQEIERDCVRVQENKRPGIPTGFVSLDNLMGGWREGNFALLAARPGVGKTSVALHFAIAAAEAGYWVNIYSYEMRKEALVKNILSGKSEVYRSNIRDGYMETSDWEKINVAISKLESLPILFRDASGMSANQVKASIRKNKKNGKCDFAIIDYLQLMSPNQTKQVRELEVAEISRTLKNATLSLNIPILALSQLNRDAANGAPKLSHLRESGVLEQDADVVFFLLPEDGNIRLQTLKHRNGKLGDMMIYSNNDMTQFSDNNYPSIEELKSESHWYNEI